MSILLSARQNILFIDCPPGVTSSPRPQSAEEMESGTSLCPSCTWNTGRKRGIHTGPLASSRPQGAAGGISQHCSPHSSLSEEKLERNFPKCLSHHQEEITAFLPLSSLAAAPKHGLPLRCVCVGGGVSAVWKTSAPRRGPVVSQVQPVLGAHAAHLAWSSHSKASLVSLALCPSQQSMPV